MIGRLTRRLVKRYAVDSPGTIVRYIEDAARLGHEAHRPANGVIGIFGTLRKESRDEVLDRSFLIAVIIEIDALGRILYSPALKLIDSLRYQRIRLRCPYAKKYVLRPPFLCFRQHLVQPDLVLPQRAAVVAGRDAPDAGPGGGAHAGGHRPRDRRLG